MMNKDYIKRFFALTEQNILGKQTAANDELNDARIESNLVLNKTLRNGLVLMIVLSLVWLMMRGDFFSQAPRRITQQKNRVLVASTAVAQTYPSQIPYYQDGAYRQILHQISLRRVNVDVVDDKNIESATMLEPLVDKVIVVPKSFG